MNQELVPVAPEWKPWLVYQLDKSYGSAGCIICTSITLTMQLRYLARECWWWPTLYFFQHPELESVTNLCHQDMHNVQCFWAYCNLCSAKTIRWKTPISMYFVQIFSNYPLLIYYVVQTNVPHLCTGVSIESHMTMLTEVDRTTFSLTWHQANVEFCEVQQVHSIQTAASPAWIGHGWRKLSVGEGRMQHN